MPTIKDLLNRIKWDKSLDPKDFTIVYVDKSVRKEIAYSKIKAIEGNFMMIKKEGREVEMPLYRIVEIKKKAKTILKR